MLQLKEAKHFGSKRLYFADPKVQRAYVAVSGRKTVSEEMIEFLRTIGVGVSE